MVQRNNILQTSFLISSYFLSYGLQVENFTPDPISVAVIDVINKKVLVESPLASQINMKTNKRFFPRNLSLATITLPLKLTILSKIKGPQNITINPLCYIGQHRNSTIKANFHKIFLNFLNKPHVIIAIKVKENLQEKERDKINMFTVLVINKESKESY